MAREEEILAAMQDLKEEVASLRGDVEARQRADELNSKLAAIVESSDDAIISKTLEGIVMTWNSGAERIFGYTAAEMIGQSILKIVPADRKEEEPKILERLRRGERVDHFATIRQAKDGRLLHVSLTISPVRNAAGKIIGASKIARDITRQMEIEEELKRSKEDAERLNAEKDQFLAVLSHELRTPLMPVLAGLSLIEGRKLTERELLDEVVTMRRNVELEAQLIDDLLDHTRISRGKIQLKREMTNLHELVDAVVGMCEHEIRSKDLSVAQQLSATKHYAIMDPKRVQQVLWNLVKNAIKFTAKGGWVEIRTLNVPAHGGANGSDMATVDETLVVEVQDSGIGISPELIHRIFHPFEQGSMTITKRFGGLGLGLSISRSFVEMHGGRLEATSEGRGRGATFRMVLPGAMVRPKEVPIVPVASARGERVHGGLRVLLVEDHADTRRMLARLLRERGYRVEQAGTVAEARERVELGSYDVLVSDIGLPDGSGLEVMEHARRMRGGEDQRGIAVSGFGTPEDEKASRDAGFRMHLAKPIDVDRLDKAIREVGGEG